MISVKNFYILVIVLLSYSVLSCEKNEKQDELSFLLKYENFISEEMYDMYSLVINENYNSEKIVIGQASITSIVLDNNSPYFEDLIEYNPDFDTSLIHLHEEINKKSLNFGDQFQSDTMEIILISSEELSSIFDSQDINGDWYEFHNKYRNSNGLIKFSRIAINNDNTQAIFEIDHLYASLGGRGSIVLLEKIDNKWTIKDIVHTWVS